MKKIEDGINDILLRYLYELNNKQVRNSIRNDLSIYLQKEVIDRTTNEMVINNKFDFRVISKGNEWTLGYYLDNLDNLRNIERRRKILKIIYKINDR